MLAAAGYSGDAAQATHFERCRAARVAFRTRIFRGRFCQFPAARLGSTPKRPRCWARACADAAIAIVNAATIAAEISVHPSTLVRRWSNGLLGSAPHCLSSPLSGDSRAE